MQTNGEIIRDVIVRHITENNQFSKTIFKRTAWLHLRKIFCYPTFGIFSDIT